MSWTEVSRENFCGLLTICKTIQVFSLELLLPSYLWYKYTCTFIPRELIVGQIQSLYPLQRGHLARDAGHMQQDDIM